LPAFDAGSDTVTGYSLGLYATRLFESGAYLDAVLQGTYYDIAARSSQGLSLDAAGAGLAASLEAGVPLLARGGWFFEPQAQIVYQSNWLGSADDAAASVDLGDSQPLAGRLGVRFARRWTYEAGASMPVTAWIRPNVWYSVLGDSRTGFSSANGLVNFRSD